MPHFLHGCWGSRSGPYTCAVGTLPTESLPSSFLMLLHMYFFYELCSHNSLNMSLARKLYHFPLIFQDLLSLSAISGEASFTVPDILTMDKIALAYFCHHIVMFVSY